MSNQSHSHEAHEDEYNESLIETLQLIWGAGFMSPGGPEAVHRILKGCDLRNKSVLDIGSGLGGIDCLLVSHYGAKVTGIDIEQDLIDRSKKLIKDQNLENSITIQKVDSGPLPFPDNHFDVVFGKDAWLHIQDKSSFFTEVFRVLKPGGQVICGDWLGGPEPTGKDFDYFVELEGISYFMVTEEEYKDLLESAGFDDIWTHSIWQDYRQEAHKEYDSMRGPLYAEMTRILGAKERDHFIESWRMLSTVLDLGNLRPALARATKSIK